ncbi:hypothetical protein PPSIR1_14605 [Plesiocystis pacifica SIR-1]|uniref:Uncharacterized protein n=1 Tax=Plesiocystis pacifica SIR-1 TaxID=391625 RepID=A6GFB4_9BACT|nr:hypothetical protein [Plesiocystis pacifica]EDM75455.1 hypothetical protein PPSIR1_14605 [Plesiocystis pacifica SIR-1]
MNNNTENTQTQTQNVSPTGLEFELVDMGPGYKPESAAATCLSCYCGSGCLCGSIGSKLGG